METTKVKVEELKPYPKNPRRGNVSLIAKSLSSYGQYKPITVNKRDNTVLAGNHTLEAAKKLGWTEIEVAYVDVDEVTAAKIVLIDNRSTDTAQYDNKILLNLLENTDDINEIGYDNKDVEHLKKLLDKPATQLSNTVMGKNLKEWQETLNEKTTRIIMLDYESNVYSWLLEKLKDYREQNNYLNNTEAIIKMLEKATGEEAPL